MCGVIPDYSAVQESFVRLFVLFSSLVIARIGMSLVTRESAARIETHSKRMEI